VTDSAGHPAGNVRVDFSTPGIGPSCLFINGQTQISVLTDRSGSAPARCTANTISGEFVVTATPLGTAASVDFSLNNTTPAPVSTNVRRQRAK